MRACTSTTNNDHRLKKTTFSNQSDHNTDYINQVMHLQSYCKDCNVNI